MVTVIRPFVEEKWWWWRLRIFRQVEDREVAVAREVVVVVRGEEKWWWWLEEKWWWIFRSVEEKWWWWLVPPRRSSGGSRRREKWRIGGGERRLGLELGGWRLSFRVRGEWENLYGGLDGLGLGCCFGPLFFFFFFWNLVRSVRSVRIPNRFRPNQAIKNRFSSTAGPVNRPDPPDWPKKASVFSVSVRAGGPWTALIKHTWQLRSL